MLGVRGNGREVVVSRSAILAAGKPIVAAVFARFGFEDKVPTGQGVEQHINHAGTCD